MKNLFKLFGLLAILTLIGLAFFSCKKNGAGDTDTPTFIPSDTVQNQNPITSDFNIGNLTQSVGNITPVTITPKAGKSTGTITIYYNGSTTIPVTIGTYTVTFNVAEAPGWNAANGLAGGTLTIDNKINAQTPVITSQPSGGTVTINTPHGLSVTANSPDGGTLSYQWFSNTSASNSGGIFTGATTANYNPPTNTVGIYYYYVEITNTIPNNGDGGNKTVIIYSDVVTLTVNAQRNAQLPTIISHPGDAIVTVGNSHTLTVTASSPDEDGNLTYQWYSNTSASNIGGTPIGSAVSTTYNPPTGTSGTFYYFVQVTNTIPNNGDGGTKTATNRSEAVTLTVNSRRNAQAPTISSQSGNATVNFNASHSLSVTANSPDEDGNLTYQWYSNTSASNNGGSPIGSAVSTTYNPPTGTSGTFYYYVVITNTIPDNGDGGNKATTKNSTAITITVGLPPLTGTVSIDGTVEVGQTLTANTSNLSGSGTFSYQWMRGTTNIGTNSSTYVIVTADVGFTITVAVTRSGYSGNITSDPTPIVPLGSVSITGTVRVGQALSVVTTNLGGSGTISYQWKKDGANISGATGSTYTIPFADVGSIITVTVTRAGFSSSSTSAQTIVVPQPVASISGTAQVGNTLTASTTNLGGTISYQWKRDGTTNIGTGSTYIVQFADEGSTISVVATVTGVTGSVTSTSTATVPQPSVNISGTAQVGNTLTANVTNVGSPSYQWRRGTTNISGATGSTYIVQFADAGSTISVVVSRTSVTGNVTSSATAIVSQPTVNISGTAQVGNTLTASTTNLGGVISYQWKRGTTDIGTGSTYIVQFAEAGSTISVVATVTGVTGSVTSTSTAAIPQPTVTISGNAVVGQQLTANVTNVNGTLTYQWKRDGNNISGATGSTYTVQAADSGLPITVTVSRTGITGSITSSSTAVIFQLAFSTTVSGNITSSSSTHRYMVVLAQAGTLVINLTSPGGSTALPNNGANVQWFNSSNTRLGGTTTGFSFPYVSSNIVLAAGTYYIEVAGRGGVGQTGIYNICVDYYTSEVEPNNTRANAQVLVSGLTVRGEITSTDTIDIYRYNLTQAGRLTMNVTRGTLDYPFQVRWLSTDGTQIKIDTYIYSYDSYMDLEIGTYYLEITNTPYNASGTYSLRGDFIAAGNNETEPNNTITTAQLLTLGQTVKGFISHQDGIDVYRYNLTQAGRLTLNISLGSYASGGLYDAYERWYNAGGTQIKSINRYDGSFDDYMDLEAGTYYIEITPYSSYTGTYSLRGNFIVAGNNETEPNNDRATAQLLTSGQNVKGFISYQDNIDMYRIVVTQSRTVTVNINWDTEAAGGLQDMWVRWLDVDGNQIRRTNLYSSTRSDSASLSAGTYYIEITPYSGITGNTGTYTLNVQY